MRFGAVDEIVHEPSAFSVFLPVTASPVCTFSSFEKCDPCVEDTYQLLYAQKSPPPAALLPNWMTGCSTADVSAGSTPFHQNN